MASTPSDAPLKRTPLFDLHVSLGAKMVPFAGYEMPVQYPLGVLKEHLWTREKAGLFDVSHMGQAHIIADDLSHETVARALETMVPADILNIKPGQQRYSQFTAQDGGILDDLMISRPVDGDGILNLVVNAGCKEADYAHMADLLPEDVILHRHEHHALLALQGPMAASVLERHAPGVSKMAFMTTRDAWFGNDVYPIDIASAVNSGSTVTGSMEKIPVSISRSGYTGEDGYEIAVRNEDVVRLAKRLLGDDRVQFIGLGARDSLRLEAGLCLYGHDIDTTTSPIEADLAWSIQKRRRVEGGFPGAARIQAELANGPKRKRVGIKPEGRAPAREGTEILSDGGERIGVITSGGFGPTVNGPVAMGYVASVHAKPGTKVQLMVRGKPLPAQVAAMPFAPHRYFKP